MRKLLMGLAISTACLLGNATAAGQSTEAKGIAPRAASEQYPAHAQRETVAVGVKLLTAEEAHKAFGANVNDCCLVVEVGLYPQGEKPLDVNFDDFKLRVVGTDTAVKPQTAWQVATLIRKKSDPQHDVSVTTTASVGYESGTTIDPVTGQPQHVHGVYTAGGVGVGIDPLGKPASASDHEQEGMQAEFKEKGLVEGSASLPVAGYLYFPIPKKKKDAKLALEYTIEEGKITLALP
jgi:hypothetical protein